MDAVSGRRRYDLENRLTKVEYDPGTSSLTAMAEYRYDAMGGVSSFVDFTREVTTRYYYDGQNVIAEYTYESAEETIARAYTHGSQYIDERAVMRDYTTTGDEEDHYYLLEELYTVAGLAGSNGVFEEAYVYDTYGNAYVAAMDGSVTRVSH